MHNGKWRKGRGGRGGEGRSRREGSRDGGPFGCLASERRSPSPRPRLFPRPFLPLPPYHYPASPAHRRATHNRPQTPARRAPCCWVRAHFIVDTRRRHFVSAGGTRWRRRRGDCGCRGQDWRSGRQHVGDVTVVAGGGGSRGNLVLRRRWNAKAVRTHGHISICTKPNSTRLAPLCCMHMYTPLSNLHIR